MGTKAAKQSRFRILIVDDHPIVRRGLTEVINQTSDLTVCGEAKDVPSAEQADSKLKPDLVLVDLSLNGPNGFELMRRIKTHQPDLAMLVLSMHEESLYAERALCAGSRGYLMKGAPTSTMLQAIRQVLNGDIYLSPTVADRVLKKAARGSLAADASPLQCLSHRELEVFQLTGRGFGPRDIASQLQLSVKTVEAHRQNIKRKLNLKDSTELRVDAAHWANDISGGDTRSTASRAN